jgi:heterodisulfide reductase subunit D
MTERRSVSSKDYSIKELIQAQACTHCCLCADVCPAVAASRDGHLSGVYRLGELNRINRARTGLLRRIFRNRAPTLEELKTFSDTVYRCTLCGRCQEVCPAGISLKDIWVSLRQDLVHSEAYPKKVDMIRENLDESHNVFAEDNQARAGWVEDMPDAPEHGYIRERADVVYFTGCVSAYFPMAQNIPIALAEILEAAEVDFTLLGGDEWCCGFPLLGAGLRERAKEYVEHNLEAVRQKGASRVVFACPSCYQMWREHYPKEFPIAHVTEFLKELLAAGRVPLDALAMTVTYHDPCDLGRSARVFEAPREILRSIPGLELVELPANRENCPCCGGGGNLEMIDADLSKEIARQKVEEVVKTGAEAVVTACQQCVRTMNTYVRRNKVPLRVLDVVQLVRMAMKE